MNRGNGRATPSPDGHISLVSGWQGDVCRPRTTRRSVPVARQADGSPITGLVLARFMNITPGTTRSAFASARWAAAPPVYLPATTDQRNAVDVSASENARRREDRHGDHRARRLGVCRLPHAPFPGTPDPTRLCLKDGFDPNRLYELTYTAKDPLVLGIGLAAMRDIVSFFRHAAADERGTPNPVAGAIKYAVAVGDSQSGNFIKTFIHLGFNEDLQGRSVWEGVFPRIAARQTPMNFRFALPGGAATLYEPGSEPRVWWSATPTRRADARKRACSIDAPPRRRARRCSKPSARPSSGACACRPASSAPMRKPTSRCRQTCGVTTIRARRMEAAAADFAWTRRPRRADARCRPIPIRKLTRRAR